MEKRTATSENNQVRQAGNDDSSKNGTKSEEETKKSRASPTIIVTQATLLESQSQSVDESDSTMMTALEEKDDGSAETNLQNDQDTNNDTTESQVSVSEMIESKLASQSEFMAKLKTCNLNYDEDKTKKRANDNENGRDDEDNDPIAKRRAQVLVSRLGYHPGSRNFDYDEDNQPQSDSEEQNETRKTIGFASKDEEIEEEFYENYSRNQDEGEKQAPTVEESYDNLDSSNMVDETSYLIDDTELLNNQEAGQVVPIVGIKAKLITKTNIEIIKEDDNDSNLNESQESAQENQQAQDEDDVNDYQRKSTSASFIYANGRFQTASSFTSNASGQGASSKLNNTLNYLNSKVGNKLETSGSGDDQQISEELDENEDEYNELRNYDDQYHDACGPNEDEFFLISTPSPFSLTQPPQNPRLAQGFGNERPSGGLMVGGNRSIYENQPQEEEPADDEEDNDIDVDIDDGTSEEDKGACERHQIPIIRYQPQYDLNRLSNIIEEDDSGSNDESSEMENFVTSEPLADRQSFSSYRTSEDKSHITSYKEMLILGKEVTDSYQNIEKCLNHPQDSKNQVDYKPVVKKRVYNLNSAYVEPVSSSSTDDEVSQPIATSITRTITTSRSPPANTNSVEEEDAMLNYLISRLSEQHKDKLGSLSKPTPPSTSSFKLPANNNNVVQSINSEFEKFERHLFEKYQIPIGNDMLNKQEKIEEQEKKILEAQTQAALANSPENTDKQSSKSYLLTKSLFAEQKQIRLDDDAISPRSSGDLKSLPITSLSVANNYETPLQLDGNLMSYISPRSQTSSLTPTSGNKMITALSINEIETRKSFKNSPSGAKSIESSEECKQAPFLLEKTEVAESSDANQQRDDEKEEEDDDDLNDEKKIKEEIVLIGEKSDIESLLDNRNNQLFNLIMANSNCASKLNKLETSLNKRRIKEITRMDVDEDPELDVDASSGGDIEIEIEIDENTQDGTGKKEKKIIRLEDLQQISSANESLETQLKPESVRADDNKKVVVVNYQNQEDYEDDLRDIARYLVDEITKISINKLKIDYLNETLDKKYFSNDLLTKHEVLTNLIKTTSETSRVGESENNPNAALPASSYKQSKSNEDLFDYYASLEKNLEQVRTEIDKLKKEAFDDLAYISEILAIEPEDQAQAPKEVIMAQQPDLVVEDDGSNKYNIFYDNLVPVNQGEPTEANNMSTSVSYGGQDNSMTGGANDTSQMYMTPAESWQTLTNLNFEGGNGDDNTMQSNQDDSKKQKQYIFINNELGQDMNDDGDDDNDNTLSVNDMENGDDNAYDAKPVRTSSIVIKHEECEEIDEMITTHRRTVSRTSAQQPSNNESGSQNQNSKYLSAASSYVELVQTCSTTTTTMNQSFYSANQSLNESIKSIYSSPGDAEIQQLKEHENRKSDPSLKMKSYFGDMVDSEGYLTSQPEAFDQNGLPASYSKQVTQLVKKILSEEVNERTTSEESLTKSSRGNPPPLPPFPPKSHFGKNDTTTLDYGSSIVTSSNGAALNPRKADLDKSIEEKQPNEPSNLVMRHSFRAAHDISPATVHHPAVDSSASIRNALLSSSSSSTTTTASTVRPTNRTGTAVPSSIETSPQRAEAPSRSRSSGGIAQAAFSTSNAGSSVVVERKSLDKFLKAASVNSASLVDVSQESEPVSHFAGQQQAPSGSLMKHSDSSNFVTFFDKSDITLARNKVISNENERPKEPQINETLKSNSSSSAASIASTSSFPKEAKDQTKSAKPVEPQPPAVPSRANNQAAINSIMTQLDKTPASGPVNPKLSKSSGLSSSQLKLLNEDLSLLKQHNTQQVGNSGINAPAAVVEQPFRIPSSRHFCGRLLSSNLSTTSSLSTSTSTPPPTQVPQETIIKQGRITKENEAPKTKPNVDIVNLKKLGKKYLSSEEDEYEGEDISEEERDASKQNYKNGYEEPEVDIVDVDSNETSDEDRENFGKAKKFTSQPPNGTQKTKETKLDRPSLDTSKNGGISTSSPSTASSSPRSSVSPRLADESQPAQLAMRHRPIHSHKRPEVYSQFQQQQQQRRSNSSSNQRVDGSNNDAYHQYYNDSHVRFSSTTREADRTQQHSRNSNEPTTSSKGYNQSLNYSSSTDNILEDKTPRGRSNQADIGRSINDAPNGQQMKKSITLMQPLNSSSQNGAKTQNEYDYENYYGKTSTIPAKYANSKLENESAKPVSNNLGSKNHQSLAKSVDQLLSTLSLKSSIIDINIASNQPSTNLAVQHASKHDQPSVTSGPRQRKDLSTPGVRMAPTHSNSRNEAPILSKSIKDLRLYVSNSFSPSQIVRPPHNNGTATNTTTSATSSTSPSYMSSYSNQQNIAEPEIKHQQVPQPRQVLKKAIGASGVVLADKPPSGPAPPSQPPPVPKQKELKVQDNKLVPPFYSVKPMKDDRADQIRIEYLKQQQMIAKIQRQQLKHHMNEIIQKQQNTAYEPSIPEQAPVKAKSIEAAVSEKSPKEVIQDTSKEVKPVAVQQTSAISTVYQPVERNDDALLNCILEMKPLAHSTQQSKNFPNQLNVATTSIVSSRLQQQVSPNKNPGQPTTITRRTTSFTNTESPLTSGSSIIVPTPAQQPVPKVTKPASGSNHQAQVSNYPTNGLKKENLIASVAKPPVNTHFIAPAATSAAANNGYNNKMNTNNNKLSNSTASNSTTPQISARYTGSSNNNLGSSENSLRQTNNALQQQKRIKKETNL